MQTIQVFGGGVGMTPQQFVERHPNPFVVFAGGALRRVQDGKTRGLTVDRLVIEGTTRQQAITDHFLVGELVPADPTTKVVTIGVSSTCDLQMDDSSLSKRHAWFEQIGSAWRIWDNDSVSGTLVNGQPVKPGEPRALCAGDRITLGYVDLTFLTAGAFHQLLKGLFA